MKSRSGLAAPTLALALAASLGALHCSKSESQPKDDAYLMVAPAARQPGTTALGTLVVIQQRGGHYLRLKAQGGSFMASASDAGKTGDCVLAAPDDAFYFLDVLPERGECLLYVDLLEKPDGGGECSGAVLADRVVPITLDRDAGGAGGSASSSSSSGSTTSSFSAGTGTSSSSAGGGAGGASGGK